MWSGPFSKDSFDFGTNSVYPSLVSAVHHVTTLTPPVLCVRGGSDSLFHRLTFVINERKHVNSDTYYLIKMKRLKASPAGSWAWTDARPQEPRPAVCHSPGTPRCMGFISQEHYRNQVLNPDFKLGRKRTFKLAPRPCFNLRDCGVFSGSLWGVSVYFTGAGAALTGLWPPSWLHLIRFYACFRRRLTAQFGRM